MVRQRSGRDRSGVWLSLLEFGNGRGARLVTSNRIAVLCSVNDHLQEARGQRLEKLHFRSDESLS